PDRSLVADCVVVDSSERQVQRAARPLGVSRCDPGVERAGDFSFDLPPGRYRVAVAVSDGDSARGVVRASHEVALPSRALSMSDLVMVCGPLESPPATGAVRLDANVGRRIGPGQTLHAYFEVYQLRTDARGSTRFAYEYRVQSLAADARPWFRR